MKSKYLGKAVDRFDGRAKVTGSAKYTAEVPVDNLAYGVLIQSTVSKGKIKSIDTKEAKAVPGVISILTYENMPKLKGQKPGAADRSLLLLQDDLIWHDRQNIGLVMAESLEAAQEAANTVKVNYAQEPFAVSCNNDFAAISKKAQSPSDRETTKRGNASQALKKAAVVVDEIYTTPAENHNPMEPFATIAHWQGDNLTLYESTQAITTVHDRISGLFDLPTDKVRVICHFVGGGFGCKLTLWSHAVLAVAAAKQLGRPVKVVLGRSQMYGTTGHRPKTIQRVALGADESGSLLAIKHDGINTTSRFYNYTEEVTEDTPSLYACPNLEASIQTLGLDIGAPTWMRAPGHAPGSFAVESALDELAYKLNIDPIELRLKNYAATDPQKDQEFSSKELKACYIQGAKEFGWEKRNPRPGSMKKDGYLLGMGMATATHATYRTHAKAKVTIYANGTALVQAGTQDIGTGTYTIMSQVTAETLGIDISKVKVELGDSALPKSPFSGGSLTTASVMPAIQSACESLNRKIKEMAQAEIISEQSRNSSSTSTTNNFAEVLKHNKLDHLDALGEYSPSKSSQNYSMHSFGAQFAEVLIDPELGTIRVNRFVGTYAAGNILNAKTARSQMYGGIIYGIGMALMEETLQDENTGRYINADLAEYHIPVHLDIPDIQIHFVEEKDPHVNSLGVKGIGELGITGTAAAIANAVYHATGKRIRNLPITLDKLL